MDPIDHQSNASGSMDSYKGKTSKYDHADTNRSASVIIFICKYIISHIMDPIDHQSNTFGSIDHHNEGELNVITQIEIDLNQLLCFYVHI